MRRKSGTESYDVGFCKPPKHTRFSSENQPSRRRRRSSEDSLIKTFKRVVEEAVTMAVDGRPRTMSRGEAVLFANQTRALTRDQRSMNNMLKFVEAAGQLYDREAEQQRYSPLAVPEPMTAEQFERSAAELNAAGAAEYRRQMAKEGR
jgi:hypothetical protein